jgi:addiction module HigA family antidote
LAVSRAADRLDVSRQTLHRILSGRSAVTADMALRLSRFTSTSPVFWLNLQAQHDLWHQGRELARALRSIHPLEVKTDAGANAASKRKTRRQPKAQVTRRRL